jgi:hypothetical protein
MTTASAVTTYLVSVTSCLVSAAALIPIAGDSRAARLTLAACITIAVLAVAGAAYLCVASI